MLPRRALPAGAAKPRPGPGSWVLEIKHDGHRLIVRREGKLVRLFTRRGYDWTERFPAIARAAIKLRARSFTLDGEAVVCAPTASRYSMPFTAMGRFARPSCRRWTCWSSKTPRNRFGCSPAPING
jgi:ATP-dependent DNA ligase